MALVGHLAQPGGESIMPKQWNMIDITAGVLTGVLTVVVLLQVLVRFVIKVAMPWTEEVARICFVYMVFLGAVLGMRERKHVNVDVFLKAAPPRVRKAWETVLDALVAILLVWLIVLGIRFVAVSFDQGTPYLRIPMGFVYASIPLSCALMLYYLLASWIARVRGSDNKG